MLFLRSSQLGLHKHGPRPGTSAARPVTEACDLHHRNCKPAPKLAIRRCWRRYYDGRLYQEAIKYYQTGAKEPALLCALILCNAALIQSHVTWACAQRHIRRAAKCRLCVWMSVEDCFSSTRNDQRIPRAKREEKCSVTPAPKRSDVGSLIQIDSESTGPQPVQQ